MEGTTFYNLTNPQKSIWFTEQFYKNTPMENITGCVTILDKLNLKALQKAINLFVQKNDSFRFKFILKDDKVLQYLSSFSEFEIENVLVKTNQDVKKLENQMANNVFKVLDNLLFSFKTFTFPDGHGGYILTAHHLIYDAWTASLVGTEIINYYEKIINSESLDDISNPSYIDYIISEQEYLKSEKFKKDKEFWNGIFNTIPEIATIPSINSNSQDLSCKSKRKQFVIPKETINLINKFCKENKASVFNFFMAVFSLYISRVSSLDNFTIGTPILNRGNFKEKQTTGMFISNIPFRVSVNHDISFAQFLSNISTDFLKIFRHQKYPYQYLLEDLRKQDSSLPNLYNIALSYQNARTNAQTSTVKYESEWVETDYIADDIDIHIYDMNDTGNINIAYDYLISKYSIDDICSIHARILHIINQILENNEINLKDIEIVTPDEKKKLLYTFNNTQMDYPKDKTISQLFEEQVEKTPDNIAVVFEDQKLTYRELNERANSLANYLISIGIKQNDTVGVHLEKSIDYIISIISILKAGASFVPLSVLHPTKRIEYILSNCNAQLLISNNSLSQNINYSCKYFDIEIFKFDFEKNNINFNNSSTTIAYILYTSGSTGNPKGVTISNFSLINHVYGIKQKFNNKISSNDQMLSVANMSFDANIQEIFIPLLLGSTLHLLSDDSIYNIRFLANYIYKNNITFTFLPPNILDEIFNLLKDFDNIALNKLLVGVESIKYSTLNKFLTLNKDMEIHNGYGPTEATICCISYMYNNSNKIKSSNFLPIGTPLSNTNILILNSSCNRLQPFYTPGEICILGDCLSSGYVDNSLNNGKFINSNYYSKIMYKTGDYGYFLPDGNIMFVGRIDNQVKINGHRIELQEINNMVQSYNSINKSVVLVDKNHIICYFTADTTVNINWLKNYLENSLPYYMIPFKFIQLNTFPMTPNGKINNQELLNILNHEETRFIKLPTNKIEHTIYNFFSDLLNTNNFSITDNFFELGGDSLSAIKLSLELSNLFNKDITAQDIFANPSVELLVNYIQSISSANNTIYIDKTTDSFSILSSAQRRIYYASTLAGDASVLYNTPGGVIFDKALDTKKLENCINKLIDRHESLRTKFDVQGDDIVQKVQEKINFKLDISEKAINIDNLKNEFNKFIKPFDLSVAPLFRLKYINISDGSSAIFIDMHHIISDGTSLTIFVEELCKLYNEEDLSPLTITYKDFSNYENTKLKNGDFKEAEDFWVNQFKDDIPVLNMPTNYIRPSIKTYEGAKVHSKFDLATTQRINTLSRELGITPYMLLLSVYYVLLSKYTAQDDIVVGTPIVGRNTTELYNIIGMFVNSLPIRAKIDTNLSFREFLVNIRDICLKDYKYQDYPFDELVNKLNIARDTSRTPLFDTMFIYQNNGIPQINFNGIKSKYYIPDTNISKFDLSLEIIPTDGELQLSFEYCTKLFEKSFIENFANHYSNILHIVLDNLDIKLSSIDMLSEKEKNKILYEFNNTKMDYPKNKTISELFEEQVYKTPDAIAVVFEDKKLTYKELNEKANSLAYYLRNLGISRNDIVGIMVNRSLEMIVSILGVLKSGACYIPIDPDYPQDRIEYMLNNSNSKFLLTFESLVDKVSFENKIFVELSNELFNKNKTNLENINSPKDLAYIIYTSGSTGEPKGVMLMHQNIINFVYSIMNKICFNELDTIISVTTISFDIFVLESILPLLNGLKIVVAPENAQTDVVEFNKICLKNSVTIIQTTPSRLQAFLLDNDNLEFVKNLKHVLVGGEPFPSSLLLKLQSICNAKIYNMYGPTETAVWSSIKDLTLSKNITIGTPINNTQMYILDKFYNLLPIGVPGELYISGDGVCKGYFNNLNLTNSVFMKNPFINNSIIYKTGDFCKLLKNGEIEYLERIDNQIKIRGLRIELGEIENKISSFPNIKKACVIKQTINNRDFLSAYFIQSKRINISNLREYLSNYLPKYMIPSYFTVLDDFPYTPNGKINKKALPVPKEILNGDSQRNYVAPKTDLEKSFVEIWENILNISPIGITDNFFELGGDSILAMNLNIELRRINDSVTYADIFKFPTISALIKKITSNNENYDFNYMEKNYDKYDELLKKEKIPSIFNLKHSNIGNVLLTGATGFLGAHILAEFINKEKGNIYCIVREEPGLTAQAKLHQKLNYYFGNKFDKLIGKRIFAVTGNINNAGFGLQQEDLLNLANNISIVINTAARVAHYGNYKDFYNSNVKSVQYLIDFCKSFNKKLYHISTLSVSGNSFDSTIIKQNTENVKYFTEKNLYIGQSLENVYIRSKFEAECLVLDAILNGLDAHILRVGNLMPRVKDGIFQENITENAFITRIVEFLKIGFIPDSLLNGYLEFTPVDTISTAIVKLITHPNKDCIIFHLFNHNHVYIIKCIKYFKLINPSLKVITEEDFRKNIKKLLKNKKLKNNINLLINDMDKNLNLMYKSNIIVESNFTIKYLSKIGFKWSNISEKYILKFLDLIRKVF